MGIKHLDTIYELLRIAETPLSTTQIQASTGFNWNTIKESLSYLEKQGRIESDDAGFWKPTRRAPCKN